MRRKSIKISIKKDAREYGIRSYYRIRSKHSKRSWALMQLSEKDAKQLADNSYEWIHIARLLQKYAIPTPQLVATIPDYHALIIEDLGDTLLEARWQVPKTFDEWIDAFEPVVQLIEKMQKITTEDDSHWKSRIFDYEKYHWEMRFFRQQTEKFQFLKMTASEIKQFETETDRLCKQLEPCSTVFTHRDFHSRNIVWRDKRLYLIDFQDARLGSKVYDLASIIFDNYFPLKASLRHQIYEHFIQKKSWLNIDQDEALNIVLQRQLKAAASYVYLSCEKKRGSYLQYIPAVVRSLPPLNDLPFLSTEIPERLSQIREKP